MEKKKQRFSLRKNKLGAISVLLGISFIGVAISGSDVKANDANTENQPKVTEKGVVNKTTEADVKKVQDKVDETTKKETAKRTEVESKKTELDKSDKEISKIKSDIEKGKDATDENIDKAEKDVKTKETESEKAKSELEKAKTDKTAKETELEKAKTSVNDKSKDVDAKKAKAKEIKDKIDGTENVTKKLENEKAKNEAAKKVLEDEKAKKVEADKELEKAKEADKKLDDDTKKAEENLKTKQAELKAKQTKLDEAKKVEAAKKAELDNILMPYGKNVKYKIALDQRFVDKFQVYMDYILNWREKDLTSNELKKKREELREELKAIEKEIKYDFVYDNYSHEDDYEIDLRNMSEEERLKMSQYGMYLLNQIRAQFGLEPLKVNKNSMQLAKEITDTVVRDNHSVFGGHYKKGISEVAAKHGLLRGGNFFENLYNAYSRTRKDNIMSRNELYEHVYNSVMGFFYEGLATDGYGHAESLYKAKDPMGLAVAHFENITEEFNFNRLPKEFLEKYKEYVNLDEFGNLINFNPMPSNVYRALQAEKAKLTKSGIIKISYIKVEEDRAIPGLVNENNMPIYDDPSDEAMERAKQNYITKYSNQSKDTVDLPAVPDLDAFKKAYADAVKVRESKEQPVKDAETEVNSATKELDTLKATEKQTEKATAKVQEIEAKVADLTTKANEQQKVVDQLEQDNVKYVEKMTKLAEDLKVAEKDVEDSAKLLETAKALQKDIETEISKANDEIVKLETKVATVAKDLDASKKAVEALRLAKVELEKNKEKLTKAEEVKTKLVEQFEKLTSDLGVISKQLEADKKELEKVKKQFKLDNIPIVPIKPVKPVDPTSPIKPVNPIVPVAPTNPVKPVDPRNPVNPVNPIAPVDPTDPVKPTDPVNPIVPVDPIKPAKPVDPIDSGNLTHKLIDGVVVSVQYNKSEIKPERLVAEDVTGSKAKEIQDLVKKENTNLTALRTLELHFVDKDGNELKATGVKRKVTLAVAVDEGKTLKVYHVNGNVLEELKETSYENGILTFYTPHFSKFVIAAVSKPGTGLGTLKYPKNPEFKSPSEPSIPKNTLTPERPVIKTEGLNTLPNTGVSDTGAATVIGLAALAVAARLRKEMKE